MNKNSKFHSLSPDDRQQILRWCEEFTYEEVVEKCALPRPEGIALETSVSAVQRFYSSYSPLCYDGDILRQCARAVLSRQTVRDPELFREVILNVVEQRIFAALLVGQPLREISPEFRILFNLHRLNSKWRKERAEEAHADHMRHLPIALSEDDAEPLATTTASSQPAPQPKTPAPAQPVPARPAPPKPQPAPPSPATPPNGANPIISMAEILDQLTGQSTPGKDFCDKFSPPNPGNPAFPANPASPKFETAAAAK